MATKTVDECRAIGRGLIPLGTVLEGFGTVVQVSLTAYLVEWSEPLPVRLAAPERVVVVRRRAWASDGCEPAGGVLMTSERQPCVEGGGVHAWESTGLDVDALGVLMTTRRCVWCGTEQHKAYGAGGRKPWRSPAKARVS